MSRSWSAPEWEPDEPDTDPGPGSYECFSSFGKQGPSGQPTAPCYSFLPKHEKSWSKVFITKGHQGVTCGKDTPGAIYKPKMTSSEASVNFPKGARKSPANITSGPGRWYDVRDTPNKPAQAKGHKTDFGTSARFVIPGQNAKPNIAPGQYEIKGALDMGLKAKSFGTSFRAYDKVLLNSDQHLVNLGRASPGPGHYRQDFGKDGFSFAMGKDMKLRPVKLSDTPTNVGPGVYRPEDVVSLEKLDTGVSSVRNPPNAAFGKPRRKRWRFDFKKLDQCGPRVWTSTW